MGDQRGRLIQVPLFFSFPLGLAKVKEKKFHGFVSLWFTFLGGGSGHGKGGVTEGNEKKKVLKEKVDFKVFRMDGRDRSLRKEGKRCIRKDFGFLRAE